MTARRPRVGSWASFERRFDPITRDDGSLLWDWCELPQAVDVRRTWTVLDCDGRLYVAAGLRFVNRLDYLRTVQPWTDADWMRDWRYD